MHNRRVASFLLGAWLLGSLFMFFVATQNFRSVERILDAPTAAASERINTLGKDEARHLLRFQASEMNRLYFSTWEQVQLLLGVTLVLITLRGSTRLFIIAMPVTMLLIVAVAHFFLTPEITRLGAMMDFVANARQTDIGKEFWGYHQIYSTTEVLKFLIGCTFGVLLLTRWVSLSTKELES